MSKKRRQLKVRTIGFHGGGVTLMFILGILAIFLTGPIGLRRAVANNSPVISGNIATYSGNQQPSTIIQNNTSIYTINIQNLTTNIGSSSSGNAISLAYTGSSGSSAPGLELNYSGGAWYLYSADSGEYLNSTGGAGYNGAGNGAFSAYAQSGTAGGTGGAVTVNSSGNIQTSLGGIVTGSYGGAGGAGGVCVGGFLDGYGGSGGNGANAGPITISSNGSGQTVTGIAAISQGGAGGAGGSGTSWDFWGQGGTGGNGGNGGAVAISNYASITRGGSGNNYYGIQAQSIGGSGGSGGAGNGSTGVGEQGGSGGSGGSVTVNNYSGTITPSSGMYAYGIFAQSLGGNGGSGGQGSGVAGTSGSGGAGGASGSVMVSAAGEIATSGAYSTGILAQSLAGQGGAGGASAGVSGIGGNGAGGGNGGSVTVTGNGAISTSGANAHGIEAQSSGGNGGGGGTAGAAGGNGGAGAAGGAGGAVSVTQNGTIQATGTGADGVFAQSNGGVGGGGGVCNTGFSGNGGAGGAGGAGGSVSVANTASGGIASSNYSIFAQSFGGAGGGGAEGGGASGIGGGSGAGGIGGSVSVANSGALSGAIGIYADSTGGAGQTGGAGYGVSGIGGNGSNGGASGKVTVNATNNSITAGLNKYAIEAESAGGNGGGGGAAAGVNGYGGKAGAGGASAASGGSPVVSVTVASGVALQGGILASSNGGAGGAGPSSYGAGAEGGNGGAGGAAGAVQVQCDGSVVTNGVNGIQAQSIGGLGGTGGAAGAAVAVAGTGGAGGASGAVSVAGTGAISVTGDDVYGILAQSLGGSGGSGGSGYGAAGVPGGPGASGATGSVTVNSSGAISTNGLDSYGILAQSIGGTGGGGGGGAGLISWGTAASGGANGGAITVNTGSSSNNKGSIATLGDGATAILAQSIGGGGGAGGSTGSIVALGGAGGSGGNAAQVAVANYLALTTKGDSAYGIEAQSLGGGGGNGGGTISYSNVGVSIGGSGGSGGNGGQVAASNSGSITTSGASAYGVLAQSVGGGGGDGGYSINAGVGAGVHFGMGGSGGGGGYSANVALTNNGAISTSGNSAYGIFAQSVGGGGGAGYFDVTAGLNAVSIGIGGSGGSGGNSGNVAVSSNNAVSTSGSDAIGIMAQSVGGGGGAAGWDVTAGFGGLIGIGGSGGQGGAGAEVDVGSSSAYSSGDILTTGVNAQGILAQSIGGGGGDGGWNVSAGVGVPVSIGGSGSTGGAGGAVNVYNAGDITTQNDTSEGIEAQSVGGGGGDGGFSVSGSITPVFSASVSVSGSGGLGGNGAAVTVDNIGSISTGSIITNSDGSQSVLGSGADAIFAQSVGGGGGNAGWSGAGSITSNVSSEIPASVSVAVSLGGSGGAGGNGGSVTVNNDLPAYGSKAISTLGDEADGIFAQSLGGGGGSGGGSVAATFDYTTYGWNGSFSLPVSIGGSGGNGGAGGSVNVLNQLGITTLGESSFGILAQSLGGGGGDGGWSVAVDAGISSWGTIKLGGPVAVGGSGGGGGNGGAVTVNNIGAIATSGQSSIGIEAQSVGGGGGNGGWSTSVDGALGVSSGLNYAVTVGGTGGSGGAGGAVTVFNGGPGSQAEGAISTTGTSALGILAQSLGGGGGVGGAATTDSISLWAGENPTFNITGNVSVGGSGGAGGASSQAAVTNYADISTVGDLAYGIEVQSVGGGGGNGGSSTLLTVSPGATKTQPKNLPSVNVVGAVSVGGGGGNGNNGGAVSLANAGNILTEGMHAYGLFAQSIGGGGGSGGESNNFALTTALSKAFSDEKASGFNMKESVSVGGSGGGASNGGAVTVNNSGTVTTSGIGAYGIFAQSVGGGGGSGSDGSNGLAIPSEDLTNWKSWVLPSLDLAFSVGGSAGSSGAGGNVTVTNTGAITTTGDGADGVYAQSLGGGGGVAAYDQSQMFTDKESNGGGTDNGLQIGTIVIGGSGGAAGNGGTVQVTNGGDIATSGQQAYGIYAQSIGGGGGSASTLGGPWHGMNFTQYFGLAVNIGGSGGGGGSGGNVTVTDTANITTSGNDSDGILAQSVGGSGGSGSTTDEFLWGNLYNGSNFSGASGTGGNVTVTQTGNITTSGQDADCIVAQSTAGGDKAGNVNVTLNGPNTSAAPGNIIANGLGSSGIVAQSLGAKGDGNVNVVINAPANSGLVQGGHSGAATNPDGSITNYHAYGVLIMDGNQNTLTNSGGGTITTLDGATGTAIMQQTSYGAPNRANLDVYNRGTITGSITSGDQAASSLNSGLSLPDGASNITVNNYQGATYNAGHVINLGSGTLINGGLVSLGATASALTGNYTQTNTGQLQVTLGNSGASSLLNVSGTANLGGGLQINLNNTQPLQNGAAYSVLTGKLAGSFSNVSLAIPNTPLLNFSVAYVDPPGADTVQIKPLVNTFSSVAYDPTTTAVGGFLDQLFAKDPNGRFALLLAEFQRLGPAEFRTAFDSLTPSVYWAATNATFDITREYERTLQQRLESMRSLERTQDAPGAVSESSFPLLASVGAQGLAGAQQAPGGIGFWMQGFGQWGSQDAPNSDNGYDFGSNGFALGLDHACTKNLILGANFAYSYTTLDMYGMPGESDINSLYGSAYGTWFNDRSYVESILTYGNHQYSMSRMVTIGSLPQSLNSSNHRGNAFSILTEAGHSFPVCQWDVEPFASIGYYNLGEGAIDEAGTLASMRIGSRTTDEVFSEVGVKVERPFHTSKGVLLPMLKAGWQHGFGLSPDSLPVSFANTPISMAVPVPDMSQDMAVIRAGLTFKANSGLTTSLGYIGLVGNKAQSNAVVGELRIPF